MTQSRENCADREKNALEQHQHSFRACSAYCRYAFKVSRRYIQSYLVSADEFVQLRLHCNVIAFRPSADSGAGDGKSQEKLLYEPEQATSQLTMRRCDPCQNKKARHGQAGWGTTVCRHSGQLRRCCLQPCCVDHDCRSVDHLGHGN